MQKKQAPALHKFLGSNNLILIVPDGYQGGADTASSSIAALGKIMAATLHRSLEKGKQTRF